MADLGGQFDAQSVAPMGDRTPLPAGSYRCAAVKSEWKPTRSGNGRFLEFTWQVLEGDHQGRMVWSRLNLDNPSAQAVQIARSELSSICRSVGKLNPRDTAELHEIPLMVKVAQKKREDTGEMTNEVKGYESVASHADTFEPAAMEAQQEKPPWM